MRLTTKVCPDPGCEAVWHNCPKSHIQCNDCGGRVIEINSKTYQKKFAESFFQYDFNTGNFFRPIQINQLCISI